MQLPQKALRLFHGETFGSIGTAPMPLALSRAPAVPIFSLVDFSMSDLKPIANVSDDGRILVVGPGGFAALRGPDGWSSDFSLSLEEEFFTFSMIDDSRALALFNEARTALSSDPVRSK